MAKTGTVYEPSEMLKAAFGTEAAIKQAEAARAESKQLAEAFKTDILSNKLLQGDATPENIEAVIEKWNAKAVELVTSGGGTGIINTVWPLMMNMELN